MVAYSIDIGALSAKRMRWNRYTGAPGLSRSTSTSSGVTVPSERRIHSLCGVRPARAHVFRERGQLREVLLDARADEIARAGARNQQAFLDQAVDRLADGDARDREFGGEVAFGRQGVLRSEDAALDRVAQHPLHLLVQGLAVLRIQGPQYLGQRIHSIVPFGPFLPQYQYHTRIIVRSVNSRLQVLENAGLHSSARGLAPSWMPGFSGIYLLICLYFNMLHVATAPLK
jgi:hypothetical protein